MKKYKLLKDLPEVPAGTIFYETKGLLGKENYYHQLNKLYPKFSLKQVSDSKWFEPVEELETNLSKLAEEYSKKPNTHNLFIDVTLSNQVRLHLLAASKLFLIADKWNGDWIFDPKTIGFAYYVKIGYCHNLQGYVLETSIWNSKVSLLNTCPKFKNEKLANKAIEHFEDLFWDFWMVKK